MPSNKDDLRILINAVLDEELNKVSINKQLKRIQANINKLKVNIQIDENLVKTLNNFASQFSKIETLAKNAGKVITESVLPDGTKVKMTTFDGMHKGFEQIIDDAKEVKNVLDQTVKSSNDSSNAMNKEATSAQSLANEIGKITKETELLNAQREKLSGKLISQNENGTIKRTINTDAKGNPTTFTDTYDYTKEAKEQQKLIEQMANAREQSTERVRKAEQKLAETQAQASNKNLEQTRKELQQQDEINKKIQKEIELYQKSKQIQASDLTRRYGNNIDTSALNNQMSKVMAIDPKAITSMQQLRNIQRDVDLGFKEIQSSAKTSSSHVLTFGEAFKTAMIKFPITFFRSE